MNEGAPRASSPHAESSAEAGRERAQQFNEARMQIFHLRQCVLMRGAVDVERDRFQAILDDLDAKEKSGHGDPTEFVARAQALVDGQQDYH